MRILRLSSLMVLSAVVVSTSLAGADSIQSGAFEFSPSVAFTRSSYSPAGATDAISSTHVNMRVDVARAFNQRFQLTTGLLAQHSARMGSARNSFGGSFGGQYNFASKSSVIPFASAAIGFVQYTGDGTDRAMLLPMLRLGFRSMLSEARSLNVSVGYQHESNPESVGEESADIIDIGIGMSLFRAPR